MFDLVVAPAGFTPSGGGSDGMIVMDPSNPSYVPPTGSSSGSGKPVGYFNPATGLTYSDPGGTQVCGNCRTDTSTQTNSDPDNPNSDPDNPGGSTTTGVGQ